MKLWLLAAALTVVLISLVSVPRPTPAAAPYDWVHLKLSTVRISILVTEYSKAGLPVGVGGGTGTGFFVSPDGYIITAAHVVSGFGKDSTAKITVDLWGAPGQGAEPQIIYVNPTSDVALIKIDLGRYRTPYLHLAYSGQAQVGDPLFVMGHPKGFSWTANKTMLSSKRFSDGARDVASGSPITQYVFQLADPIQQGVSGGPVVDINGDLVCMAHSGYFSATGSQINFAVPSEIIRWVLETNGINVN